MQIDNIQLRVSEIASEYFSHVNYMKINSSDEDFRLANKLMWQLALILPPDVLKAVAVAVNRLHPN